MPVEPNPTPIMAWPHQVNVPVPDGVGMFISVQIQSDGTATPEAMDDTLQDLVDYLQAWSGRRQDSNVTGQKYDSLLYTITPTNPV
jgi:hypothetical protein